LKWLWFIIIAATSCDQNWMSSVLVSKRHEKQLITLLEVKQSFPSPIHSLDVY
jgi:hypothetical protein